jgi:two-component system NtrC family sensor kinase
VPIVASILVIQGSDKDRAYDLYDGQSLIGRQQSCAVKLTDGTVSRRHAKLTPVNGRWLLEDLGSANGTYLNGVKLARPMAVKRGEQLRCGATLLVFGGGRPTEPALDLDEDHSLLDAAIVATLPSNEDSVIIPTPEAGAQAIENIRVIYDLMSDLGSIFNIPLLLQKTLDKVFDVFKADRGYILLVDPDGNLSLSAARMNEDIPNQQIPVSRTIVREVVHKQVGVLCSNAMDDKRFASGKSVHDFGIRSAICAPIPGRSRILGVIHVDCSVSEQTYSTEQLRLLTAIGYQTGLAIENVKLHEAAVQSERLAAVGETVASLSHHIKNILHALGSGIDVVEMGLRGGDLRKANQAWPIVERNLGRINGLILNMLAFSKRRDPLLQNLNVNHVLSECVDLVSRQADERGVAVLTDLDDLPPIPADADGLNQAFLNLLNNALDAVEDRSGVITVASTYDSMDRNVVVRVIDNGSGIGAEEMDRIFTPFYSSKGQGGTGLGLAVARKVFEEHHGKIEVESEVGEGTTFTVTLPALPPNGQGSPESMERTMS